MGLNKEVKNSWDKLGHGRREDMRAAGRQMIPVFMNVHFPCWNLFLHLQIRTWSSFELIKVEKLYYGPYLPLLN